MGARLGVKVMGQDFSVKILYYKCGVTGGRGRLVRGF